MNRDETKQAIAVMQAWLDGARVRNRGRYDSDGQWYYGSPSWDWAGYVYEVVPEPREGWVKPGDIHHATILCEQKGCIRVREVIE